MRGLLFFLAVLGGCSSAAVYYPTLVTVATLAETLGAVNKAGLADTYKRMYEDSRDTGLFSADALRRVGTATGSRYLIAKLP